MIRHSSKQPVLLFIFLWGLQTVAQAAIPVRNDGLPRSTLLAGTSTVEMSLTTDIPATCRYSAQSHVAYAAMTLSFTPNSAGTTHRTTLRGLVDSGVYRFHVRCADRAVPADVNTTDYAIFFSVGNDGVGFDPLDPNSPLVGAGLDRVLVRPNPWRSDRNAPVIRFSQLPLGSTIKIFTVSGHLVREYAGVGTSQEWDLRESGGDTVASGLYLYLIESPEGQTRRGKLAILR